MRYRILLTGRNKVVKDDFFVHLEKEFELQTTSLRLGDIISHIRYYKPEALVMCMRDESKDDIGVLAAARSRLYNNDIPVIVIGSEEECQEFESGTGNMSSLIITRPVALRTISDNIIKFIEKWQAELEEERAVEEGTAGEGTVEEGAELPEEGVQTGQNGQPDMAAQEGTVPPEENKPAEKKNILVVDDDPMMLKLIKEQLKDVYSVATAINSKIAFKFLENKRTDLILLDYEMPGENGAQVLEKVRNNVNTASLPVIFLTGMNDKEKIRKVLELKPQGYLLKPIDRDKLRAIIKKNIG